MPQIADEWTNSPILDHGRAHPPGQPLAASGAPPLRLTPGTLLYREGEAGSRAFLVKSGEISLLLSTEQGNEVEVGERTVGMILGIEALFISRYGTSARAETGCVVGVLHRSELQGLSHLRAGPARALLRQLIADVSGAQQRLLDLAGRCATARLASVLLQEAVQVPGGLEVRLPWGSKGRLARRLGVKQETLSRLLQELVERGAIELPPWGVRVISLPILEGCLH